MARGSLFSTFKGFDAFGKTMEDVKIKTRTGALLTMVSAAIIFSFTLIEFIDYRRVYTDTSVIVDRSRGERLIIKLNVTFPKVPCYLLSMDVMDISGEHQVNLDHSMVKTRMNEFARRIDENTEKSDLQSEIEKVTSQRGAGYCGDCYGGLPPENGCCNSCEDVRQAYLNRGWSFANPDAVEQCRQEHWTEKIHEQSKEGCNIAGKLTINKVIGNIHLSPGRSFLTNSFNVHELVPYLKDESPHTFGHIIHELSFENASHNNYNEQLTAEMRRRLGIVFNPLDTSGNFSPNKDYMYQYFLKVVGTRYHFLDQSFASAHQYSVTTYERDLSLGNSAGKNSQGVMTTHGITGLPGVFFNFEISPMMIEHHERRQSFAHFLTSMCAIVGGVLTVATLLDGILFRTQKIIKKGASAVQEEKSRPAIPPVRASGYGNTIKMS